MAHYFFDMVDGEGLTTDETGIDFSSLEAMRIAAIAELHHVALEEAAPTDIHTVAIHVRNQTGKYVFRAAVSLVAEWITDEQNGAYTRET